MEAFRHKLIAKILFSSSHYEVKRYCNTAVKELERRHLHPHLVARFVEKTVNELNRFSPMHLNAQLWSNVGTAKVLYKRVLLQYSFVHE